MKKHLFIFCTLFILLVSCKKTYTCECNTTLVFKYTNSPGYYSVVVPGSKTPYTEKLTEKQARAACQHEEAATETNFKSTFTYNGSRPLESGESIKTSCGLK